MAKSIRIVTQKYDTKTGHILEEKVIYAEPIVKPKTIHELGYSHATQINLLQALQDFKLAYQATLINSDEYCPNCDQLNRKQGKFTSPFHAIFTDHDLAIQRRSCRCGWKSSYTVEGLYGVLFILIY